MKRSFLSHSSRKRSCFTWRDSCIFVPKTFDVEMTKIEVNGFVKRRCVCLNRFQVIMGTENLGKKKIVPLWQNEKIGKREIPNIGTPIFHGYWVEIVVRNRPKKICAYFWLIRREMTKQSAFWAPHLETFLIKKISKKINNSYSFLIRSETFSNLFWGKKIFWACFSGHPWR